MFKKLRNWFIGDYLRKTPDLIERARIILIYQILLITFILVAAALPSMILHGHYIQLARSGLVVIAFAALLFSLKLHQSVSFASHCMMIAGTANLIANIYFIFQEVDGVSYLLAVADILFAFYFLKWSWAYFYMAINLLAVCLFILLDYFHLYAIHFPPRIFSFDVFYISVLTIFILTVIILRHFRIAFDLSSRSLKKALKQQKKLTQKYVQLSEELNEAKEKAEEMNRLKTNFLNNMSHEIRTPLNGILGIAQIIENETEHKDIKEYVGLQKKSGERLLNTITSILTLSRMEAEKPGIQLQKVEVNQLVLECFIALKALALQKKLDYQFFPSTESLYCWGEPSLLHQVMNNLMGNAIKFTHSGNITVSTGVFEKNPEFLFIRVRDTGIGIADEFLPNLFQPFLQESSGRNRHFEGSGLGLSIAKKYVELLGGNIIVESKKEAGSTFCVLLPVKH